MTVNWMGRNSLWVRAVVFALFGSVGALIASAAETTQAWPSDRHTHSLSGPAGEFAREIKKLADESRRGANDDQCHASDLTLFWRMSESERQDEKMIQGLAELLKHDGPDETCLASHIVDILSYIGPPARAALPVLKDRLEAERAVMAQYRAEKWERIFLDESSLRYRLEQTIATIEGAGVFGRKTGGP